MCVCQTIVFSVEWVQFRLIYNLLPSYKICFHIFLLLLLFVDFIKWICVYMCVGFFKFVLAYIVYVIYINIYWLCP